MKAGGKSDGEVTSFRHTLVEFDEDQNDDAIPKEIQYGSANHIWHADWRGSRQRK
jgi:hypothetical protein